MTYAVRAGQKKFDIATDLEIASIYQYYARWIREGKLKVDSDWNKDLKIKFTVQDPCQIVRKSYGDPVADDLRYVVKTLVGGRKLRRYGSQQIQQLLLWGWRRVPAVRLQRGTREYGRLKLDQILATGADYCIAACHNCHAQIHDLAEHFEASYHTVHLWTLICLSLGVLGENEREYLGPDLAEVGL